MARSRHHTQRRRGHILLIKPRGKRRNFYDPRDLTIICHQFYVPLKYNCAVGNIKLTTI